MRKLTTALALATAVTALAAGTAGTAAAAPGPAGAVPAARRLALHSWTLLNEHGPGPNPGERLTARVDARTVDGHGDGRHGDGRQEDGGRADQGGVHAGPARGHAVVQHVFDADGAVRVEFTVNCLTVDGSGAVTVTGPIESVTVTRRGDRPVVSRPSWGPLAGLTYYPADGSGERRVGWAASDYQHPEALARVTGCTPIPAGLWIIDGGTVLHR
ncbi:hypothetical protein AB0O91_11395 [Kitasatospora sp. NPDC089797]|uniref:hypothetical protein n=1 Tax=Kitasatospora sp. NPDC089797 TaxID=3155298 RepID=UPI00342EC1B6